jgi:hypothetical protein
LHLEFANDRLGAAAPALNGRGTASIAAGPVAAAPIAAR